MFIRLLDNLSGIKKHAKALIDYSLYNLIGYSIKKVSICIEALIVILIIVILRY